MCPDLVRDQKEVLRGGPKGVVGVKDALRPGTWTKRNGTTTVTKDSYRLHPHPSEDRDVRHRRTDHPSVSVRRPVLDPSSLTRRVGGVHF